MTKGGGGDNYGWSTGAVRTKRSSTDFCRSISHKMLARLARLRKWNTIQYFNGNVKPSWRKVQFKQDCNEETCGWHFNKGRLERMYAINRKTLLKQDTTVRMLMSANMMLMVAMRTRMTGAELSLIHISEPTRPY